MRVTHDESLEYCPMKKIFLSPFRNLFVPITEDLIRGLSECIFKNVSMKTVRLLTTESEPLAEKASTVLLDSVSSCVISLICRLTSFTDSILSR